jgi:hypothetical protein
MVLMVADWSPHNLCCRLEGRKIHATQINSSQIPAVGDEEECFLSTGRNF